MSYVSHDFVTRIQSQDITNSQSEKPYDGVVDETVDVEVGTQQLIRLHSLLPSLPRDEASLTASINESHTTDSCKKEKVINAMHQELLNAKSDGQLIGDDSARVCE